MYLLKLLSSLPLSVLYVFSSIFSFLIFHVFRYRRSISFDNISKSFPEKSEHEIKSIQKMAYRHLTDTFFEMIKAYNLSEDELHSRMTVNNTDEIKDYLNSGKSLFLLTAHTATVEWAGHALRIALDTYIDPVYKPVHSELLDKFIFAVRSRYDCSPIPYKQLAKDIVLRKNVTRCIAMLADLEPRSRDQIINVNFLNRPTRFFLSSERIAKLAGMPVFFVAIKRVKRGYYQIDLKKLCDDPTKLDSEILTRAYSECVEKLIMKRPEAWLWTHKRWKHLAPTANQNS